MPHQYGVTTAEWSSTHACTVRSWHALLLVASHHLYNAALHVGVGGLRRKVERQSEACQVVVLHDDSSRHDSHSALCRLQ